MIFQTVYHFRQWCIHHFPRQTFTIFALLMMPGTCSSALIELSVIPPSLMSHISTSLRYPWTLLSPCPLLWIFKDSSPGRFFPSSKESAQAFFSSSVLRAHEVAKHFDPFPWDHGCWQSSTALSSVSRAYCLDMIDSYIHTSSCKMTTYVLKDSLWIH